MADDIDAPGSEEEEQHEGEPQPRASPATPFHFFCIFHTLRAGFMGLLSRHSAAARAPVTCVTSFARLCGERRVKNGDQTVIHASGDANQAVDAVQSL